MSVVGTALVKIMLFQKSQTPPMRTILPDLYPELIITGTKGDLRSAYNELRLALAFTLWNSPPTH